MTQPLDNIRILDFSWVLAGPYATRVMADFGAEVIKVQSDTTTVNDSSNLTAYFNVWNRSKLGISLNLSKDEGVDIAKRLVSLSDVVVENYSPRVMDNWGLDYQALRLVKPDIIMLSLSGVGHTGIFRDRVAFGATIQALSGLTGLTSHSDQHPSGLGYSHADHVAGLMAALSILEALEYRRKTGIGQYIDLSEYESMTSLMGVILMECISNQHVTRSDGNGPGHLNAAPHNVYRCKGEDRWCAIGVFSSEQWHAFCQVIGNPGWIKENRFATSVGRRKNASELDCLIEEWTKQYTPEEVMERLQAKGVPAGVVQDARDLSLDIQLKDRGFYREIDHPILGPIMLDSTPIKLSQIEAEYDRAAPGFGQDNIYVYHDILGMSMTEIEENICEGIIS
ncbi:MAG: CoA transferase [Chloroflexota bacterium]|nr:CoA transferase [Chloroflexota bacterium]